MRTAARSNALDPVHSFCKLIQHETANISYSMLLRASFPRKAMTRRAFSASTATRRRASPGCPAAPETHTVDSKSRSNMSTVLQCSTTGAQGAQGASNGDRAGAYSQDGALDSHVQYILEPYRPIDRLRAALGTDMLGCMPALRALVRRLASTMKYYCLSCECMPKWDAVLQGAQSR